MIDSSKVDLKVEAFLEIFFLFPTRVCFTGLRVGEWKVG